MKTYVLVLVLFSFFTIPVTAQSHCECESLLGDECRIKCPKGSVADCENTWYGGCDCDCNPQYGGIDPATPTTKKDTDRQAFINLNNVKLLREFINKPVDIKTFNKLINEMKQDLTPGNGSIVIIPKKGEKYKHYFNTLRNLFAKLDYKSKKTLYKDITLS